MFTTLPLPRYRDWGKLALRLAIAGIFLAHGSMKWALWSGSPPGMPAGMLALFKILSIVEPLAAVAILLGMFTRGAALVLAIVMVGAIYTKIAVMHLPYAAGNALGWEFDAVILAGCLVLLFEGAGRYAVDAYRKNR